MNIIVMTGDSHTWGQGVGGESHFNPGVVGGDLRLMPFGYPNYVNLVRKSINSMTGSSCGELEGDVRRLKQKAELFRVELHAQASDAMAEIYLDGELCTAAGVPFTRPDNAYKVVPVLCGSGEHEIEIRPLTDNISVYRIEYYSGGYAVVNSGVGSCPVRRYLDEYWNDYVLGYKPYIAVHEGNTINDWLTRETPEQYYELLKELTLKTRESGIISVMHTTAPIGGNQAEPFNAREYNEFIEQARKLADIDTNALMAGIPSDELFSDNWHVNQLGHRIYAENIVKYLEGLI